MCKFHRHVLKYRVAFFVTKTYKINVLFFYLGAAKYFSKRFEKPEDEKSAIRGYRPATKVWMCKGMPGIKPGVKNAVTARELPIIDPGYQHPGHKRRQAAFPIILNPAVGLGEVCDFGVQGKA